MRCCVSLCCVQRAESAVRTRVTLSGSPPHLGRRRSLEGESPRAKQKGGGFSFVGCCIVVAGTCVRRRSLPVRPASLFPAGVHVCALHIHVSLSCFVNKIVSTNFVQIAHIYVLTHGTSSSLSDLAFTLYEYVYINTMEYYSTMKATKLGHL